jgi:hypothetical protein
MDMCTPCTAPDGATPECENVFHLFLRLQDEHGHAQITVTVDQNVCALHQVLICVAHFFICASRVAYWVASCPTT